MNTDKVERRLDLRGKVCPGPTFDTRMTLNEMAAGELLAGVAYARRFIEEAKSEGLVKAAIERAGLRGVIVAPLK